MPDLTTITGTLTDASGVPRANARLTIRRVIKGGELISDGPVDFRSDEDGLIEFEVHRDSVAYIDAPIVGLNNKPGTGVALTIPDTATANLEDLIPATSTTLPGASQAALQAHVESVLDHEDVPDSYVGQAGKTLVVNEDETALEFGEGVGGGGAWGGITGTLSDQADLQAALDAKATVAALTVEATARANADTAEASARLSADTTLQNNINTEAATRAAADAIFTQTLTADATLNVGNALRALILVDTSVGDVTVTLQPAADVPNREITFKKIADDNLAVIDGDGSETIDGSLVFNLEMMNQTVKVVPVGSEWYIA